MIDPSESVDDQDIRLGSLALRAGYISAEQLRTALSIQAGEATGGKQVRQLGEILLSRGFLDGVKLESLLRKQKEVRSRLG